MSHDHSQKNVCLYLHAHQPLRVKPMSIFDVNGQGHYFDYGPGDEVSDRKILDKVSEKSYLPTLRSLLRILDEHPGFKVSLSITGTLIEQLHHWRPDVLSLFQQLAAHKSQVEIIGESYYHSLAFIKDIDEFTTQVKMHQKLVERLFDQTPTVFRGTELMYNNHLASWAAGQGYKAILSEGVDELLGGRSPNHAYDAATGPDQQIAVLLKNYKLSDDIAFRFGDKNWAEWPLTADKFSHWIDAMPNGDNLINLFMDFETFGEHQWNDTGIFDFLAQLPDEFKSSGKGFILPSEAASLPRAGVYDCPDIRTWADTERDLTAWLGNAMQYQAFDYIYAYGDRVKATQNPKLISDWRRLQTSDHFYYMCTKWANDGDVHAYFSPYSSPYDAFIYYMNALRDFELRLVRSEVDPRV